MCLFRVGEKRYCTIRLPRHSRRLKRPT
jgi:hypothetical protein